MQDLLMNIDNKKSVLGSTDKNTSKPSHGAIPPKDVLLIAVIQSRLSNRDKKLSAHTRTQQWELRSQSRRSARAKRAVRSVARERPKFCWMANPIKLKGAICCGGGVFLNALWLKWLAYLSVKIRAVGANERRPCVVPRAALARSLLN